MRRLTDEEREIRSGRGIPPKRWWPFAVALVAVAIASVDLAMFERCTGKVLDGGGRGGMWVRAGLAYPCSPFLLRGSWWDWLLFAGLWLPVPFAVVNLFWLRRHKAFWDRIRRREKEKRAEKRAQKLL